MSDKPRDLPPFSGREAVCIKCGADRHFPASHSVEWVPKGMYTARGTFGECLERRCSRCGYTWAEAVLSHADLVSQFADPKLTGTDTRYDG